MRRPMRARRTVAVRGTATARALALVALVALGALLALPGVAGAGGFATVGLSSLPDGTAPGTPWRVTLTILQHGKTQTPMRGLHPRVVIRSADGRTTRTFAARPAGKSGEYRADVVFPSAGRWSYTVADGFTQTHRFAPVAIGGSRAIATPGRERPSGAPQDRPAAGTADSGGGNVLAALGAAVAAGLLAALATAALLRRRPPGSAAPAPR